MISFLRWEEKLFTALEVLFLYGNVNCVQKKKELKSPPAKLDSSPYSFRKKKKVNFYTFQSESKNQGAPYQHQRNKHL